MKGKRVLRRKRNPLWVILGIGLAVLLAAGIAVLKLSGAAGKAPAEAEELTVSSEEKPMNTEPDHLPPEREEAEGPEIAEETSEPEKQDRFVISLLGDCTLSSSHYTNHFESLVGDDLEYPFSNVAELLTADDLTLANLECTFSDKRLESNSTYAFCGRPQYARSLVLGGVDCVSMANNHTNDFGTVGVTDTAAALEDVGVTGIQGDRGMCFDLRHDDGTTVRIGIYVLAFNGSREQMKKGVARLQEDGADIVIACMHTGAERIYVPTARQTNLAHAAIQGGADVVVGTHPHILQPAEAYQGGVILYSIGNFCFGGNRNPGDKDTVIAQLIVHAEETGVSWEMTYIPCSVSSVSNTNDYRPTPYIQGTEAYERCLGKLETPWNTTTAEEAAAKAAAKATAAETAAEATTETTAEAAETNAEDTTVAEYGGIPEEENNLLEP